MTTKKHKPTVFDVAAYILKKHGEMTVMKLQKLCYYSHAWSLVWDEKPLYNETIEAWVNGPVIPDLYRAHKGMYSINIKGFTKGKPDVLDDNQRDTINKVIGFYGQYNPQQLSTITHQEYPWIKARQGLHPAERGCNPITNESMAEYYSGL